ncbi:helix-turn-helix transcriptional regulator [Serratia marcescens]|uniref:helix-turn-helix transcriptional regulator n=1 Tax=Serratia TaxID=613 RepID=UPI001315CFF6|nr:MULTISPECIES: helix-turn-helix transcriptional regulator [Serratia]MBH3270714.1 helix-turn-helix transcriptional regulator [Serratia marcescens]MDI3150632.1 LuxR C-terminal-related transcriptional regulator [Serratia nevei]QHC47752.1 LuxR family transcriptional regulator [Serratia marcescens]
MDTVNIIIDDENRYFSLGLESSIIEYAAENNKSVCFITPGAGRRVDVVIASSRRRNQRWRRSVSYGKAVPVVTIKEKPILARESHRVLYRTDSPNRLFELLTEALANTTVTGRFERQALTVRERQVMGYLRRGFDQSQTARVLGVSVKTVHSHKRSVMSKMMLSRSHDFIYWLLSHEGEYS